MVGGAIIETKVCNIKAESCFELCWFWPRGLVIKDMTLLLSALSVGQASACTPMFPQPRREQGAWLCPDVHLCQSLGFVKFLCHRNDNPFAQHLESCGNMSSLEELLATASWESSSYSLYCHGDVCVQWVTNQESNTGSGQANAFACSAERNTSCPAQDSVI